MEAREVGEACAWGNEIELLQAQTALEAVVAEMDLGGFAWTREPAAWEALDGAPEVTTLPHTDLWQRTYYHFRNDNAPVFQTRTGSMSSRVASERLACFSHQSHQGWQNSSLCRKTD